MDILTPGDGPNVIIRRRIPEGRIDWNDTIPRYWKSRETGDTVEIRRYLRVVNEGKRVVIYAYIYGDAVAKGELSLPLPEFKKRFESKGNTPGRAK